MLELLVNTAYQAACLPVDLVACAVADLHDMYVYMLVLYTLVLIVHVHGIAGKGNESSSSLSSCMFYSLRIGHFGSRLFCLVTTLSTQSGTRTATCPHGTEKLRASK